MYSVYWYRVESTNINFGPPKHPKLPHIRGYVDRRSFSTIADDAECKNRESGSACWPWWRIRSPSGPGFPEPINPFSDLLSGSSPPLVLKLNLKVSCETPTVPSFKLSRSSTPMLCVLGLQYIPRVYVK